MAPASRVSGALGPLVAAVVMVQSLDAQATPCPTAGCLWDQCRAKAVPVIPESEDLFEPLDTAALPQNRDTSHWQQNGNFLSGNYPFWLHVDTEGDYVFAADNTGLQIWQHTGAASFPRRSRVFLGNVAGVAWCGTHELKQPIQWVSVPEGDSNVAVLGSGMCELGMLVFDTSNKNAPIFKYQAFGFDVGGVWSTKVGGAEYAVAGGTGVGARVYDLAAARALGGNCRDDVVGGTGCGVYQRRLGTMNSGYPHGVGQYVALAGERMEIWDLASASTTPLVSFDPGINGFNRAVSMSSLGGSTYLVGLYYPSNNSITELALWDVTSCLTAGCAGAPPLLDVESVPRPNQPDFLTTSMRGGRPQIYVGTQAACVGDEAEWLFEVAGSGSGAHLQKVAVRAGYWDWYYPTSNVNGTWDARPRSAAFVGDTLYRAMWTFFDAHQYRGGSEPPISDGGAGAAGAGGTGGTPTAAGGTGGTAAGPGGSSAVGGAAPTPSGGPASDDSGCGCRTTSRSPASLAPLLLVLLGGLCRRRRRDAPAQRSSSL